MDFSSFSSGIAVPEGSFTRLSRTDAEHAMSMLAGIDPTSDLLRQLIGQLPYVSANLAANHNAVMNGSFQIWQRNNTFTAVAHNAAMADRWRYHNQNSVAVHTVTRDTDTPGFIGGGSWFPGNQGFTYSIKLDCTTIDASVGATDVLMIKNIIEGPLSWHKIANRNLVLSFWVKATKTGIYSVSLNNNPGLTVSFIKEFTVMQSEVWEKKVIPIPAFTGNWVASDHCQLSFVLMAGSSFQGTTGAWTTQTQRYAGAEQVNGVDSVSNNFWLTGVQLEVGVAATEFKHLDFTTELFQCMRYYEKSFHYATVPAFGVSYTAGYPLLGVQVVGASTSQPLAAHVNFRVPKVATATGSNTLFYNPVTGSSAEFRNITAAADCTTRTLLSSSQDGMSLSTVTAAGSAAGQLMALHWATDVEL